MSSFHMINLAANHTTVITCGSELTNRTGPRGGLLGIEFSSGHRPKNLFTNESPSGFSFGFTLARPKMFRGGRGQRIQNMKFPWDTSTIITGIRGTPGNERLA